MPQYLFYEGRVGSYEKELIMRTILQTSALIALFTPVLACVASTGTASSSAGSAVAAETVVTAADAATDTPTAHRPHHHPGPDFLIVAALHEPIGLTADQEKTLQGLLPTAPPGPRPFDKARAAALAAGIRAGKVDVTAEALPPSDFAVREASLANALNTLHATLSATQRRALVDAVEQRAAEHATSGRGGPKDHAGPRGPLEHLLEGLDVTAAQEQEIEAKLAAAHADRPSEEALRVEHDAARASMRAKLETFAGDNFDGAAFVTPSGAMRPGGHDRFLTYIAIVTSVLDASQREKLAARIEAGPRAE
jgi:hypothetical protein